MQKSKSSKEPTEQKVAPLSTTTEETKEAEVKKPYPTKKEADQTQALIEQSDEYKMWKAKPKAHRERLTRKQMMRVMKPDMLAEGLSLEVSE